MGCLKRIVLFIVGWLLLFPILSIISHVFGVQVATGVSFVFVGAGMLYVLFGGIFDDNDDPPSFDDDLWRRRQAQLRGEAAWQNQMRGKYK